MAKLYFIKIISTSNILVKVKYSHIYIYIQFSRIGSRCQMTVPTGCIGKNKYARTATEKKSMQLRALRLAALSEIPINRNQG